MSQTASETRLPADWLATEFRAQFPYLQLNGRGGGQIAYLDAGATSQKPQRVIDALSSFYSGANGAINRGTHLLADTATGMFEQAREDLAEFFQVPAGEIVWTSGATDAINLVAAAFTIDSLGFTARSGSPFHLREGDNIVVTRGEHHANLLPWQYLADATGAELRWLELDESGAIDWQSLQRIDAKTRIVAFSHMSNVTGNLTDPARIVAAARAVGAFTLADTCQSVAHMPVALAQLGVDAAVASAHKMYGPTGVGMLWMRGELLEQMPPVRRGGSMIADVRMSDADFLQPPARMEAGTQAVAQVIGWAAAIQFLREVGMQRISEHESRLSFELMERLKSIDSLRILGSDQAKEHHGVFAFTLPGIHPHDIGQVLDSVDVAVRVGHHCAIPLHRHFGVPSSARATVSVTTTLAELDRLAQGLELTLKYFQQ